MSRRTTAAMVVALIFTLIVPPRVTPGQESTPAMSALPAGVEVIASGLTNPRGFTWDADGALILALAGTGGPNQVIAEGTPFPFFGGKTSSIVRIENGCPTPVAEDIASFLWTDPGWIWGAMDVAYLDGQLYALLGGGGADTGQPESPNGVFLVNDDGTTEVVADLSAWFRENPPVETPWDYGADGSLFDLEAGDGQLWVSEAVGGRVLTVTPDGETTLVADLSVDHLVPTGVALAPDGGAYVNHETVVPFPDGAAKVIHLAADGTMTDQWTGLTAGTDLAMGPDGALYAVEMATGNSDEAPYLTPGSGRVVRQTGPDSMEPVVTDIAYPVYIAFGPDDALYLTYPAFGPDAGEGQGALLRLDLSAGEPLSLAGMGELAPSCTSASTAPAAAGEDSSVAIADFTFAPQALTVTAGTTVTWANQDWAPHTVTADDGAFDSGRLDLEGSYWQAFDTVGQFTYRCAFHPMMTGTVIVQ